MFGASVSHAFLISQWTPREPVGAISNVNRQWKKGPDTLPVSVEGPRVILEGALGAICRQFVLRESSQG